MPYKIGDKIIVTAEYDSVTPGHIGKIIRIKEPDDSVPFLLYGCVFEENESYFHTNVSKNPENPNREYWVKFDCCEKVRRTTKPKTCQKCGRTYSGINLEKSANGKYYCRTCSKILQYSTKNDVLKGKPNRNGLTFGFELESVPKSRGNYLNMLDNKYGLIPTSDASLPSGGVEFKTPTYVSLSGVKNELSQFEKWVDFSDAKCGQHINVGNSFYLDYNSMSWIRSYSSYLFKPLRKYMSSHKSSVEKICGRFFNNYAENKDDYTTHTNWVNLSHDNRIEFRISKFVTSEQYYALAQMWGEMVNIISKEFICKYYNRNLAKEARATIVGDMLVDVFKKYENAIASN